MARKRTCAVCDGDHFRRVTVTLLSGKARDTGFVYCCNCLLVFYRAPERKVSPTPILHVELLRSLSAAVVNDAMQKLPDPNTTETETVSIQHYVDYHGKVTLEFEHATAGAEGCTWRYWRAKTASKAK